MVVKLILATLFVLPLVAQTGLNVPTQLQKPGGAKGDGATDDTTAIANQLGTGNDVWIPAGTYIISGSGLTLSHNGQRLMCLSGAILQAAASTGQLLKITGTGNTVSGCTFNGASNGSNGSILVFPNGATDFQFLGNTIENTIAGQYAFRCDSCTGTLISGNVLATGILGTGLTVFKSSNNVQVVGNTVVSSAVGANVQAFDVEGGAGGTAVLQNITITGNSATATTGFCYQVAKSGGLTSSQIAIVGNTCSLSNTSGTNSCSNASSPRVCGGISIPDSTDSVVADNVISGGSQNVDIAGIEFGNTRMTISHNTVVIGPGTSGGGSGIQGYCTQCRIVGNSINGWGSAAGSGGIKLETNSSAPNQDDNVIANNTVTLAAAVTGQSAFYIHCATANTGTQNRNSISGNTVIGVGTTSNSGFNLFPDAAGCAIDQTHLVNNQVYNMNKGLQLPGPTAITAFANRFSTVTTPVNCTGACTWADLNVYGQLAVNTTSAPGANLDVQGTGNVTGLLKASGGQEFTSGTAIGKTTAAVNSLDVHGTMSVDGTICISKVNPPAGVGNCNDTAAETSNLMRFSGGDGTNAFRGDIYQLLNGGAFTMEVPDGQDWQVIDGGTTYLHCYANVGCSFHGTTLGGATIQTNGQWFYCTDCKNVPDDGATAGQVCQTMGHGNFAFRVNAHWICP